VSVYLYGSRTGEVDGLDYDPSRGYVCDRLDGSSEEIGGASARNSRFTDTERRWARTGTEEDADKRARRRRSSSDQTTSSKKNTTDDAVHAKQDSGSSFLVVGVLLALIAASLLLAAMPAEASMTFAVTNTNDSGAGTLRQAILDVNATAGADVIDFNIPTPGAYDRQECLSKT